MQLVNHTRFAGAVFVDADPEGTETLVVVIKATYLFGGTEELRPAPVQDDPLFSDVYAGEPGASSLLYESDANWGRRGTDVALMAHAYPTGDRGHETEIRLRVGRLVKTARVFGDRAWQGSLTAGISSPKPFDRIPLVYERAFGGTDHSSSDRTDFESEPRNPVGRGLRAKKSRKPVESISLPNIEDPRALIASLGDRPAPVGFTFVAKSWKPRSNYAGTYDDVWRRGRMPLLPADFDPRYYTAASDGLVAPFFTGGEPVELINLTASRKERFALPTVKIEAAFHVDAAPVTLPMRLDTVVLDAVRGKILLVWHGSQGVRGLVDDIHWVLAEARHG